MKCENCGKNEVGFVYQSNVNGHVTEKHLCSECAEKLGYTQRFAAQSQRMMQSFFGGGLLEDFFSPRYSLLDRMNRMLGDDPFDDFFTEMPALGTAEQPKPQEDLVDQATQEGFSQERHLNALRVELRQAVDQENYERAAELRDEIRALESKKQ